MPIAFDCPGCRKAYTVEDALAGQKARCKHCGREFRIPGDRGQDAELIPVAVPIPRIPPDPGPRPSPPSPPPPPPLPRSRFQAAEVVEEPRPPLVMGDPDEPPGRKDPGEPEPLRPGISRSTLLALGVGGVVLIGLVLGLVVASSLGPVPGSPEEDPEAAQAGHEPAPPPAPAPPPSGPRVVLSQGRLEPGDPGRPGTFEASCRVSDGPAIPGRLVWIVQSPSTVVRLQASLPAPGTEARLRAPAPEGFLPAEPSAPFLSYLAIEGPDGSLLPVSNTLPIPLDGKPRPEPQPEPRDASTPSPAPAPAPGAPKRPGDPFRPPFKPGPGSTPF